jgi:hypothetical protein
MFAMKRHEKHASAFNRSKLMVAASAGEMTEGHPPKHALTKRGYL